MSEMNLDRLSMLLTEVKEFCKEEWAEIPTQRCKRLQFLQILDGCQSAWHDVEES